MAIRKQETQPIRLHLLGPFELFIDGVEVDVPRSRVRDLLTLLATQSPDIISHDSLIDGLWVDELPKNPRAALRVVLSRARKSLGIHADALASTPMGLRLYASTDIAEFLAPELDGDDADTLVRALALWRGEPHSSVLPTIAMHAHAHQLTERRIGLLTRLAELLIDDDRPTAASALLEPELRLRPTAENLATRLARSYAADGRKSDALRTLESTRLALRDELGVSPTPEFDALERLVLNDTVELVSQVTTSNAGEATPFVGRTSELKKLLSVETPHLALVGEAGIGKTRLLDEVTRQLEVEGQAVVRTRCPQTPQRTMEPLAEILEQTLVIAQGEISSEVAFAIRRVDRTLTADPGDVVSAPIRRSGMVSILAGFVCDELSTNDSTLIIDDLHWIDGRSAEVLREVMIRNEVRTLLAMRPMPTGGALQLDDAQVDFIELDGLDKRHTDQLVSLALGSANKPELVSLIHEQSAGNPFFIGLLASLVAEGVLRPSEPLPISALVAVQSRIDRLSGPSRQTLLTASVLGQTIDLELLTALRPSAVRDMTEAIVEGLVRHTEGDSTGHFVHALVAQGAYELLSETQRSDIHDQVAAALAGRTDAVIEFARHAAHAEAHDPHRCVEAHLSAARVHLHSLSYEPALAQVRAAKRVMRRWELRDDSLLAQLRLVDGEALRWDDGAASAQAFLEAASLADSMGDTANVINAVLGLCRRGHNTFAGAVDDTAVAAVEECLQRHDLTAEQRARLLAGSSLLFAVTTDDNEVRERFHEAIAIAREIGNTRLEAEILLETDFGLSHPSDFAKRVAAAERLRELAGNDPDLRWEAAWLDFGIAVVLADAAGASAACTELRDGLAYCVQRPRDFGMAIVESVVCQAGEQYDDAHGWADHALNVGLARYPESWAMNAYGALLLGIRRAQGRVEELRDTVEQLLAGNPNFPTWEICAAYAALEGGDLVRSTQLFDGLARDGFARVVQDGSWTSAVGVLAEIAARLGRPEDAAVLYEMLEPFSGTMLWSGLSSFGPVDASLAAAAAASGLPLEASTYGTSAITLSSRLRSLGEISRPPPTSN